MKTESPGMESTQACGPAHSQPGGADPAPGRPHEPGRARDLRGAAPLGPVLDALLARLGLSTQARRYRALQLWDQVVGPVIAGRARPYRLTGDVLWVAVRHPGWAQELAFLKATILRDLNAAVGGPVLRDLRFTTGTGPRQARAAPAITAEGGAPSPHGLAGGVGEAAATLAPDGEAGPGAPATWAQAAQGQSSARPSSTQAETATAAPRAGGLHDPELQTAVARWLQAARRRRRWALARGWLPCAGCGSLYPPEATPSRAVAAGAERPRGKGSVRPEVPSGGALCPACRAARQEALRLRVRSLLERDPWLACAQVATAVREPVEAVARLYREERAALQDRWRARLRMAATRLRQGEPPSAEIRSLLLRYALLQTGAEPGRLEPAAAREAVGPRLAPLWDVCFGPPSVGSGSPGRSPAAPPRRARRGARGRLEEADRRR